MAPMALFTSVGTCLSVVSLASAMPRTFAEYSVVAVLYKDPPGSASSPQCEENTSQISANSSERRKTHTWIFAIPGGWGRRGSFRLSKLLPRDILHPRVGKTSPLRSSEGSRWRPQLTLEDSSATSRQSPHQLILPCPRRTWRQSFNSGRST